MTSVRPACRRCRWPHLQDAAHLRGHWPRAAAFVVIPAAVSEIEHGLETIPIVHDARRARAMYNCILTRFGCLWRRHHAPALVVLHQREYVRIGALNVLGLQAVAMSEVRYIRPLLHCSFHASIYGASPISWIVAEIVHLLVAPGGRTEGIRWPLSPLPWAPARC